MEGFCRACLIKYEEPMDILQYTEKNRRLYVYCTGLQVKRNDVVTFELCKDCYVNMKLACKFKKQCRTSDKRLKNYFALKELGDPTDFNTYLMNNDDSLLFKFPMLNGNITPSGQLPREADNESSTNTSIRNFMKDLLRPEEIPDTEARIIREVIEEEADILDDSLDSRWLEDDISIDTDFRFSPFSTPKSRKNEQITNITPKKEILDPPDEESVEIDKESFIAAKKILLKSTTKSNFCAAKEHADVDIPIKVEFIDPNEANINPILSPKVIPTIEIGGPENGEKTDSIDQKLERALQSTEAVEFRLEDILATPPIYRGLSAPSTPTIKRILFGDKPELQNVSSNAPQADHCIEKYQNVNGDEKSDHSKENHQNVEGSEVDILEDFFNKETGKYIGERMEDSKESIVLEEYNDEDEKHNEAKSGPEFELKEEERKDDDNKKSIQKPGISRYDLTDMSCKLCNTKYRTEKGLKIHFTKYHKSKIVMPRKGEVVMEVICDHCGKTFMRLSNLAAHMTRMHIKKKGPQIFRCNICSLEFSGAGKLKMHQSTHNVTKSLLPAKKKNFVCTICGYTSSSTSNLKIHVARHLKVYSHECPECGKGYIRKSDMVAHLRTHNKERPFGCKFCVRKFRRRDTLNRHMKQHTDERPYKCDSCKTTFITKVSLRHHRSNSKKCYEMRLGAAVIDIQRKDKDTQYYVVVEHTIPGISNKEIIDKNKEIIEDNNKERIEDNNKESIVDPNEESMEDAYLEEEYLDEDTDDEEDIGKILMDIENELPDLMEIVK